MRPRPVPFLVTLSFRPIAINQLGRMFHQIPPGDSQSIPLNAQSRFEGVDLRKRCQEWRECLVGEVCGSERTH